MKNLMRAPFIRNSDSSESILTDMLLASIPAALWGVYVFGARCITIYVISMLFAFIPDFLFSKFVKKRTGFDISSLVTGLLVAFVLPVSVPLWIPAVTSFMGIVFGKLIFGGTGKNAFNPAATGICLSYLIFSDKMTVFTKPFEYFPALSVNVPENYINATHVSTALDGLKNGVANPSIIMDEFYGLAPGSIGDISFILIFVGIVYLLIRRTVHFDSLFSFVMFYMLVALLICNADCEPTQFVELELFTGPIALVMMFMLNDYSTTPTTAFGRIIFGALLGIGIILVRVYGNNAHYGEFFVVVCLNIIAPIIESVTYPRVFGTEVRKRL